jgi:hypothetical protein
VKHLERSDVDLNQASELDQISMEEIHQAIRNIRLHKF